ncbi:MAG TPA: cell surface protein SprA [Chitinophagaceae bacterium]|nr:cell surface protein SprA [Chitinophagaceae bacterium]
MAAGMPFQDTGRIKVDTLKYPIQDRRGDRFTYPGRNTFDLKNPSNITDSIEYDPATKRYYIVEKIGGKYYRSPTYLTFEEFQRIMARKAEIEYFQKRANILSSLNRKMERPKLQWHNSLVNRIFGAGPDGLPKVEIRPQGNIDILAGYQGQNIKNPALPERARRTGGFDFDMNANLSVIGNIGDKLKLPINYNTLATFDFENQLKLDYTGRDDEIIKRIEAGNVAFSTKGSLIQGAQSLFGLKTQLQFGKLYITGVIANQKAQRQSQSFAGGSATITYSFRANDYEENRHFLLSQYFRKNYNSAMRNLPVIKSQVQILRMEVWVTNRNGSTTETRDVVGLMDLGEKEPYSTIPQVLTALDYPFNDANDLYRRIITDPDSRNPSLITGKLSALGLKPVQDFEKTFARKLGPNDYIYNQQVGFISLNQPLQPDEVLAVAFQYSYNGRIYQVGEFSQDIPPDTTGNKAGIQKVLFLKLLKATSQRTQLPTWDLMMKNIYTLRTSDGSFISSIQPSDFRLQVLYEEPSMGPKPYLPEGDKTGIPLIRVLNLDRLNTRSDPQPDGVFDYLEGLTVVSSQARIIFPLLEPFGHDLDTAFTGPNVGLRDKYLFYPLYDTIKEVAKTYANLDRFIIAGSAKGQSTSEISLGAFNVPPGSVTVSAGGQVLRENYDYSVDYNLGTVKIINQAIINSGVPVSVQYENNAGFGIQQRNFMGLRLDYIAKNTATEQLSLGATMVRLGERPFFTKTVYNEDPIRNTMYGVDFNYRSDFPRLTRWLDKLPFYTSNEMSTINAYGEAAYLKPGHPPQIGKGGNGLIFVDDFEGTRNSIDLRFPLISWALASTPQGNGLFPEADLRDSLAYGFNRAKLAWYNIEPVLQDNRNPNNPVRGYENLVDPTIRPVTVQQIFPNRTTDFGQAQLVTFDLAYYPREKGPYNFEASDTAINAQGRFLNPTAKWGGIMRAIDQVDFETGNVEFIEFWLQDPFLNSPGSAGGQLYFNLGNISEDILRDGRRFFENGLNTPKIPALIDSTSKWGRVPANPIQVTNAFSNDPDDRPYQDVGFDGLTDDGEKGKFQQYLAQLAANFGVNSPVYQAAINDPSLDNFRNYRDAAYDQAQTKILGRYKNINNPHGNSPVASGDQQFVTAFTLYPDQEELNRDNTLNELEEYFQYRIDLRPADLQVGRNFITDIRDFTPNGGKREKWYLFRIPIAEYEKKIGNIPDFKSIRFIRMFLHNFSDSVVCRFAKLELIRNQWRRFTFELDTTGQYKPLPANTPTDFNVLAVNKEENSFRKPVRYVEPPGVVRQQQLSNNNTLLLQNEQAISMQVCRLERHQSRGVFKTMNLDLRQYGRLQMFIHVEATDNDNLLADNDLSAVIRLGNDFINNYYEIRIPLKKTPWGANADTEIWPMENELDLELDKLVQLKVRRNNLPVTDPRLRGYYSEVIDGKTIAIYGNPNLGEVRAFFLGVSNDNLETTCSEIWFNELRLSQLNEEGAYAALGRVDFKIAGLGTAYLSGSYRSIGFGPIDQRVNQRPRDQLTQLDFATSLELGLLMPKNWGISIPFYGGISKATSTPQYDPYDLDIKLKDKIKAVSGAAKDSIKNDAIDQTTITTINFTNVRKNNTSGKKQKPWSVENLDLTYSYTKQERHTPLIESDERRTYKAGVGYNYVATPKYWEPFKRVVRSRSPWFALFKDINFNPLPSLIGVRADIHRQFGIFRPRNVGVPKSFTQETYDKFFTFDRVYNLRWDLTRSINLDFSAQNRAWVDEDSGRLDRRERERMWNNFWRGGRNVSYTQRANASYVLPTTKFPLLDWTSIRLNYTATFNWIGASLVAKNLGNTLQNGQDKNITAELDFTRLYSKSRWLRALDQDAPASTYTQPDTTRRTDTTGGKRRRRDPNAPVQLNGFTKALGRILTSVKRVSINYTENATTTIYGYTDSTQLIGTNLRSGAPGLGFIFGKQPDTNDINRYAQKGWLTMDPNFNYQNRQDYSQKISITAQLQPVRDLNIDINLDKTFGKSYSELYKDTLGYTGKFSRLNPYSTGSFSVSYIAFQTLFEPFKENEVTAAFRKFQDYRIVLSERLAKQNPYTNPNPQQQPDGYYVGYTRYSQDVLLPAFIAAYTGKDPQKVSLIKNNNPSVKSNPFSGILPRPNWRVTYNGLTRIPGLEKIFSNFSVSHAYSGTLSMNSFNSALLFQDPFRAGYPFFIDTLSGNFVPYFLVPNITISEQFAPLLDLDMQFTNQVSARFEYRKSRTLSLSLVDFQLSENRTTEFTIGAGWRKRGFPLPFRIKLPGKDQASNKLDNDINFRLDFSLRDVATSNSRLDQTVALPTSGQKEVIISPSIDYVLNNRVNIKLYFDQRRVIPKISTAPPITTTRAGLQIRIALAQ